MIKWIHLSGWHWKNKNFPQSDIWNVCVKVHSFSYGESYLDEYTYKMCKLCKRYKDLHVRFSVFCSDIHQIGNVVSKKLYKRRIYAKFVGSLIFLENWTKYYSIPWTSCGLKICSTSHVHVSWLTRREFKCNGIAWFNRSARKLWTQNTSYYIIINCMIALKCYGS